MFFRVNPAAPENFLPHIAGSRAVPWNRFQSMIPAMGVRTAVRAPLCLLLFAFAGCLNVRPSECRTFEDCATDHFCAAGMCTRKLAVSQTCSSAMDCASGYCTDGVCCETTCARSCYACNVPGAIGRCAPVPESHDEHNDCPADPSATCLRAGGCDGRGACKVYQAGTLCRTSACGSASSMITGVCDGKGHCEAGSASTPRDCTPYACSASGTCATSCTSDAECTAGYGCRSGTCGLSGGLLLHLRLDETEGMVANDSSGNGHHGQYVGLVGQPIPSLDKPTTKFANPRSLAFTAANRHAVRIANMAAAFKRPTGITLAAWYRATAVDLNPAGLPSGGEIVTAGNSYMLRARAIELEVSKRTAPAAGAPKFVQCFGRVNYHLDGKWHHLAGVHSEAGMKLYLDGVEVCNMPQVDPIGYDQGPDIWLGRHGFNQDIWDFDGNIDDVRIYGRVLTEAEIAWLAAGNG